MNFKSQKVLELFWKRKDILKTFGIYLSPNICPMYVDGRMRCFMSLTVFLSAIGISVQAIECDKNNCLKSFFFLRTVPGAIKAVCNKIIDWKKGFCELAFNYWRKGIEFCRTFGRGTLKAEVGLFGCCICMVVGGISQF